MKELLYYLNLLFLLEVIWLNKLNQDHDDFFL